MSTQYEEPAVKVEIVDDDADVCHAVSLVLGTVGHAVTIHSSADSFLTHQFDAGPRCLIVDLLLPGMTGLRLCQEIAARKTSCAFILMSGRGDVSSAVDAMRLGAIDFLEKPLSSRRLLDSVNQAIEVVKQRHQHAVAHRDVASRFDQLSARERDVLDTVAAGLPTKVIAKRLGISTRTVDVHRSRIMHKLGIESPFQLARLLSVIGIGSGRQFSPNSISA